MLGKWSKTFLVTLALIAMIFWAINYKDKNERIQSRGYELFSLVDELKEINNDINNDILKSALYRFYSYDYVEQHISKMKKQIELLMDSDIYKTEDYPHTKELLKEFSDYETDIYEKIDIFNRKNGKVKNSLNFVISSLKNIHMTQEENQELLHVMGRLLSIRNSIGLSSIQSEEINIDFLRLHKTDTKKEQVYINLFITHIELLSKHLPIYINSANELLNVEKTEKLFIKLKETVEIENNAILNKLDLEYYVILVFAFLTVLVVIYYIFLTEKEKQRIIALQRDYKKSVTTDFLTGLKNRNAYMESLSYYKSPTVVLFDVTDFSSINNLYGIEVGDYILKSISNILKINVEKIDNAEIFKVGADTFVILMEKRSVEEINLISSEILTLLENEKYHYAELEQPISVQMQAGISSVKPYIINAGIALKSLSNDYHKKIATYDSSLDNSKEIKENIAMIHKVKHSLINDNITMLFQPMIDLNSKKVIKHEALVRLKDNDEYISPFYFLELSKKAKLYTQITYEVINKSLQAVHDYGVDISINLSIEDILHKQTHDFIIETLEKNRSITSRLTFELLESEEILDFESLKLFIHKIKGYGCKIAIDDFGSGYSNYNYLLELEVDILKIDGSLIKNIDKSESNQLVVKSIVEFAKLANIKTVAEFVSSKEIEEVVTKLGIDFGQGYYYSMPKPL